jgi:hypothetical protein
MLLDMVPKARRGGKEGSTGTGRSDPGWKYCTEIDLQGSQREKGYKYVKCNFCGKTITGGIARMKEHFAKTHKNVGACAKVPLEVETEIKAFLAKKEVGRRRALEEMEEIRRIGAYTVEGPSEHDENALTGPSGVQVVKGPMDLFVAGVEQKVWPGSDGPDNAPQCPLKQINLNSS